MNDELNDVFGNPIVYKSIKIYPVKMGQSSNFYTNVICLTINKKSINEPKILKMSYLDFLVLVSTQAKGKNENLILKLTKLLQIVLKEQKFLISINEKGKAFINILTEKSKIDEYDKYYKSYNNILNRFNKNIKLSAKELQEAKSLQGKMENIFLNNKIIIKGNDFEKIRKIILKQNLISFKEIINSEMKEALDEAKEYVNKKSGEKATTGELIVSYACEIGLGRTEDYESIKNLTIFQFYNGLKRKNLSKQQTIVSIASAIVGQSLDKIPGWLDHLRTSEPYEGVILNKEEEQKIKSLGNFAS